MLIHGVGVDLVHIPRIEAALTRFGDKFAHRILGEIELDAYAGIRNRPAMLGKHFAAKEAYVKALGTGFRFGISWRDIQVGHEELGRPCLVVSGRALAVSEEYRISASHLSLTDESDHALAFVTLLKAA